MKASFKFFVFNFIQTVTEFFKFWTQKILQEKLTKLTKIFIYIKSSSHFIHYLQAELTHFGLRALTNFSLVVSQHLGLKKSQNEF